MKNFEELLNLAQKNKKRHAHEQKENSYYILNSDETYPAFIMDAEYNEEDSFIVLYLTIIKGAIPIERNFRFKVFSGNSSSQYDAICETLGTSGNPSDLIGKCVYIHIEKNGDYQNLRVDAEMEKSEFEEMISAINNKSTKAKKTTKSNKTPYVKPSSFKNEMANEKDDIEEEFLEEDDEEEE